MPIDLEKLPQIAQDKANHHLYGEIFAVLGGVLFGWLGFPPMVGAVFGAAAAGAFKEVVWDKLLGRGDPSIADFVATLSGAVPVVAGMFLVLA